MFYGALKKETVKDTVVDEKLVDIHHFKHGPINAGCFIHRNFFTVALLVLMGGGGCWREAKCQWHGPNALCVDSVEFELNCSRWFITELVLSFICR